MSDGQDNIRQFTHDQTHSDYHPLRSAVETAVWTVVLSYALGWVWRYTVGKIVIVGALAYAAYVIVGVIV